MDTTTHDERDARTEVAVIGGGLAGLTAAVSAARAGAEVILIDGRSVGGRARSARRDGFVLNEGGHALYRSGGGRAVLDALGVRIRGAEPDLSTYRVVWDGSVVPFPATPASIATSRLLGARSKAELLGWFADVGHQVRNAGDGSLAEWLEDRKARPDLRRYVLALMRLVSYSARPELAPARTMLGQLAVGAGGLDYLDGGWQTIVDELARIAAESGVTVLEQRPVVELQATARGWSVSTPRGTVESRAIVLAAGGPANATRLLADDPAGWSERAGPIQRVASLDVGGRPGEHTFLMSADEPLYLSQHAPVARLAPEGQHLYSLMRYLAPDDPNRADENRQALERHAARAGLPPRAERLVDRFLAAPVVAWGSPQVGMTRPTGLELADRRVFAAGDWVGPGLLSDAAILSGVAAGRAAAERVAVAA